MEADAIVQIAKDLQDTGVKIAVMVGDDDSSAIKKLRDEFGSDIEKRSDLNHVKKISGTIFMHSRPKAMQNSPRR